jgi:TPP-dependent pyruvate/acetoin dehydrogenase alpha subunit
VSRIASEGPAHRYVHRTVRSGREGRRRRGSTPLDPAQSSGWSTRAGKPDGPRVPSSWTGRYLLAAARRIGKLSPPVWDDPRQRSIAHVPPSPGPFDRSAGIRGRRREIYASKLDRDTLLGFYRTMLLARRIDDKEIQLKRQNKIFFQISGAGHEAIQVAAAALAARLRLVLLLLPGPCLLAGLGMTALEHLLQAVGAEADPASGGRQMPAHWGRRDLNIVSTSSPTGTQFLQAVGTAEAGVRAERLGQREVIVDDARRGDEVVFVTTGDGTTSEGEFWESLNSACNLKLPVVYIVEDNGYAISVPVEVNTAGRQHLQAGDRVSRALIQECDGTDIVESYETMDRAVEYARQRRARRWSTPT